MYIYHALINALSAHMIHINLNMIFYTHVKHSPTKTIYIKYYLIIIIIIIIIIICHTTAITTRPAVCLTVDGSLIPWTIYLTKHNTYCGE